MGWSTNLFCNINFNKKTYNNKGEVINEIENLEQDIRNRISELKNLAVMTEPNKFFDTDGDILDNIILRVEDNIDLLEEDYINLYKLNLLLENWDSCHNEQGLAINPPDDIQWDTAYLDGDFVKSVKYPGDNSIFNE